MHFELTAEHHELAGLARDVFAKEAGTELLRRLDQDPDAAERLWQQVIEVGLPGLLVPEDAGGLGLDEVCLTAVAEEFGRACLPLPLGDTIALAPELAVTGTEQTSYRAAWATLDRLVPWPHAAQHIVLDGHRHEPGSGRFDPVAAIDRTRPLGRFSPDNAGIPLRHPGLAGARATLASAAELIGMARSMLALACGYVSQRHQFGLPIGSFQAIKHHLANTRILIDFAAPAVAEAGWQLATKGPDHPRSRVMLAQAKQRANDAAVRTARWVIQCHGGMGYTTEYDLHFYAKRTWALSVSHGSSRQHRRTIIDHLGLENPTQTAKEGIR